MRAEEVVCRQGGEEFLLLIPDADLDAALERAEQLRRRVAGLVIRYGNINLSKLTISCGVATTPASGMTAHDMLRAADRAL